MNIPNFLTLTRFLLVLVFVVFFRSGSYIGALLAFLLAGITDILDGFIARKYHLETEWGKLLDPLADKFMIVTVLFFLYTKNLIPVSVILIILGKEILMVSGAIFLYKNRNVVVKSNIFGKAATVVFYMAIILTFFKKYSHPIDLIFMYVAVVMALLAMVQYAIIWFRCRDKNE